MFADLPEGGALKRAEFEQQVLPKLLGMGRKTLDQEITEEQYATTLAVMDKEVPAFRVWLLNWQAPKNMPPITFESNN